MFIYKNQWWVDAIIQAGVLPLEICCINNACSLLLWALAELKLGEFQSSLKGTKCLEWPRLLRLNYNIITSRKPVVTFLSAFVASLHVFLSIYPIIIYIFNCIWIINFILGTKSICYAFLYLRLHISMTISLNMWHLINIS